MNAPPCATAAAAVDACTANAISSLALLSSVTLAGVPVKARPYSVTAQSVPSVLE